MPEVLLLDGAMGTALLAAGLPAGALPEEWVLARPAEVAAVHAAHAAAGARILLTCTFNVASPRLGDRGLAGAAGAIAAAAAGLARTAGPGLRIAGAVGPTGLVTPGGPERPPASELRGWYAAAFGALAAAGVELLWAESQWDLDEARAALAAGRAAGLPVAVTVTPLPDGEMRLPGGPPAAEALRALAADGAAAVGVNCVPPGAALEALASWASAHLGVPLVAKPSAGLPGAILGPGPFADRVAAAARAGARWIGGCCGTGAEHLAALAARAEAQSPRG
ncbi:MAG TPA: homocysteine S-methyltransferase family protein [Anaeromyxobacteraceae bacterium]|nr:homocysteine S-methyltransferase family protein [Anaeromyxobacteraceae bacterium]